MMRVLVACEFSGIVREAFRARGHDAWSLDLLDTEIKSKYHYYDYDLSIGPKYEDMLQLDRYGRWDLVIAHPPCTYLSNSGVKHLYIGGRKSNGRDWQRWRQMGYAAKFFRLFWLARAERVCIENPIMHGHGREKIGLPEVTPQIIQPWMFGHGEIKATCLWLRGLPALVPTNIVEGRKPRVHHASPGPDRWKERSRTLQGIADAMAEQWGGLCKNNP
jgi:hypothetical protein